MNAEERAALIEAQKETEGRPARIWAKDEWRLFDVYRVPVDALLLNIDNRRFAVERRLVEDQLGRSLDIENQPTDEESVVSILLDTGHRVEDGVVRGSAAIDYLALRDDWLARKQETPFWIRPDGTVRNGNRRLAMVKREQQARGRDGFEFVDAIILDQADIDERELFRMEQREQLTENLKVQYTDINRLLAIRDAAIAEGIDWNDRQSVDEVAGKLRHIVGVADKNYANVQLQAIRFMDAYLHESNEDDQYQKLKGQVERFRDVGKVMTLIEEQFPDDAADMLGLAFATVRAGLPHLGIRQLRKMFLEDRERFDETREAIESIEAEWNQAFAGSRLEDPTLSPVEEDGGGDEEAEADAPGPVVPGYPKEQVGTRILNAIDGMQAAASDDVASNLQQVLSRLEALTDDRDRLRRALEGESRAEVEELVTRVLEWSERARSYL